MVTVNRGSPSAEHAYRDWPKSHWAGLLGMKRNFLHVRITHDCRCLVQFIDEAREFWRDLGFQSLDDMIQRGLELEPVEIDAAYRWLKVNAPETAVSLAQVVKLAKHGGDRRSAEAQDQADNISLKHGSQAAYLLARLERDHPDLAEQVRSGHCTAHRAALKAGFRHPATQIRTDDLRAALRTLLRHYSRADILAALQEDHP